MSARVEDKDRRSHVGIGRKRPVAQGWGWGYNERTFTFNENVRRTRPRPISGRDASNAEPESPGTDAAIRDPGRIVRLSGIWATPGAQGTGRRLERRGRRAGLPADEARRGASRNLECDRRAPGVARGAVGFSEARAAGRAPSKRPRNRRPRYSIPRRAGRPTPQDPAPSLGRHGAGSEDRTAARQPIDGVFARVWIGTRGLDAGGVRPPDTNQNATTDRGEPAMDLSKNDTVVENSPEPADRNPGREWGDGASYTGTNIRVLEGIDAVRELPRHVHRRRPRQACTTSSMRSWTTRSTRPWPATANAFT